MDKNKGSEKTISKMPRGKNSNVEKTKKDKLPQTGDEGTKAYQGKGLLMLIASFALAILRRKRNEK